MKKRLTQASEFLFHAYLRLCLCWIVLALGMQLFFVYLMVSDQEERAAQYANEFEWKFDDFGIKFWEDCIKSYQY